MGDDIVSFILKSRERGRMDDQITQQLLSVGWRKDKIAEAFARINEQAAYDKRGYAAERPPLQLSPEVLAQSRPAQQQPAQTQNQPRAEPSQASVSQPSQAQSMPTIQTPVAAVPSSIPAANQIELEPPQKKSLFSSLFGKKPDQQAQPPVTAIPQSSPQIARPIPSPPTLSPPTAATPTDQVPTRQIPPISLKPIRQGMDLKKLAFFGIIIILAVLLAAAIFNTFISPGALTGQAKTQSPAQAIATPAQNQTENKTSASGSQTANASAQTPTPKTNATASKPPTTTQKPPNSTQQNPPVATPQPTPAPVISPPAPPMPAVAPPVEQTPPEPQNSTNAQAVNFTRVKKFYSSWPYGANRFCSMQENGTFYRAHYLMYYGGDCVSEKGAEGFANSEVALKNCEEIPCCFAGPYNEYSTGYDYFECGYS
ncbi:MAG: hypothetical protein NT051_05720 [Candidatus Micrarchaeota archaeon]|nr:hypothetical protein [Candidatus Micrarchaeota archaeon]